MFKAFVSPFLLMVLCAGCSSASNSKEEDEVHSYDPATGIAYDPVNDFYYDPVSGLGYDPETTFYFDPATGYLYDASTGNFFDPVTGATYPYADGQNVGSSTSTEANSLPQEPVEQSATPSQSGTQDSTNARDDQTPETVAIFDMTFGNCELFWDPTLITVSNFDTISVTDTYSSEILTLELGEVVAGDEIELSSEHRSDTGLVINLQLYSGRFLTNLDTNYDFQDGFDGVSGAIIVNDWQPENGIMDIEFDAVTLVQLNSTSDCELNGRVKTTGSTN
ncbi:MAG: hypothetical protein MK135_08595 [Polyangiaceae bacterium]|nr:hypothetical protein [Polyangiaceae bacterium]